MEIVLQWLLLTTAVALGWLAGRFRRSVVQSRQVISDEASVRDRLQFLFTNYSDQAVENFVELLAVNCDTVSLHLSIGSHFRHKGETERAIVIHQNLLARPELSSRYSTQVTFELALDYLTAGLLDRAETLLQELMGDSDYGHRAAMQLIEVYQQQKEWLNARNVAVALQGNEPDPELNTALAHITCEIAEKAFAGDDQWGVQKYIKEALDHDPSCARASFIMATLLQRQGNYKDAISQYLKVFEQKPEFGSDAIDGVMAIESGHGDIKKLVRRLRKLYARWPSTTLLLALVKCVEQASGRPIAIRLLREELEERPSVGGLLRLVEMAGYEKGMTTDEGRLISRTGELLLVNRPIYRCVRCGFSGQQLHWLCPSCKQWETVRPIQGVEAE